MATFVLHQFLPLQIATNITTHIQTCNLNLPVINPVQKTRKFNTTPGSTLVSTVGTATCECDSSKGMLRFPSGWKTVSELHHGRTYVDENSKSHVRSQAPLSTGEFSDTKRPLGRHFIQKSPSYWNRLQFGRRLPSLNRSRIQRPLQ